MLKHGRARALTATCPGYTGYPLHALHSLILVLSFTVATVGAVQASEADDLRPIVLGRGSALIVRPDGHVFEVQVKNDQMNEALKGATPVAAGEIFINLDGKLFSTPDRKMGDGNMLSEKISDSLGK